MTQFTIGIPIINDDDNEPTERFQAQLSVVTGVTPSSVSIGSPNPTNIDINDNDSKAHHVTLCVVITICCYRYCR